MLGESASPFIDEGDGLTSERERVRMLLCLFSHASGYRMMVGAHNTVGCWMHVGGYVVLFWVSQMSVPAYTVDAQRHMRSFTMFARYGKFWRPQQYRCLEAYGGPYRMGVNGAHNTVEENVDAYNIVCVREVAEYCFCWCTGYSPWYCGLTCAPCFSFSVCSLVFSKRASPVSWS